MEFTLTLGAAAKGRGWLRTNLCNAAIARDEVIRENLGRSKRLGRDWRDIPRSVRDHLRLRHPHGDDALRYNPLQKLAYLGVIFVLAPLIVGTFGALVERTMLSRLYKLDHLYGLLFTFGLALTIEGTFRYFFGSSGQPYPTPPALAGGVNLGFMFLPIYRGWVIVASLAVCIAN